MLTHALLLSILSEAPLPEGLRVVDPIALVESADRAALDLLTQSAWAALDSAGVEGRVSGRIKSTDSLLAKMVRKDVPIEQVHDRLAVRIRVPTVEDCYRVLDRVHATYRAVDGEYDDYIAEPKPSGYRSLHTAVQIAAGQTAEFQVRTHAMHDYAEHGPAAHWRYKAGEFAV